MLTPRRAAAGAALACGAGAALAAYRCRPRPSSDVAFHERLAGLAPHPNQQAQLADAPASSSTSSAASVSLLSASTALPDSALSSAAAALSPRNAVAPEGALERLLLRLAGALTVGVCSNLGWLLFRLSGKRVEVRGRERLDALIAGRPRVPRRVAEARAVEAFAASVAAGADWALEDEVGYAHDNDDDAASTASANDPHATGALDELPLITVANHNSMLDDPGLASALFDLRTRLSWDRMRWGVCTEEVCFAHPALAAYFGAGKAVPVQRGGGLHQKGVAQMQCALNRGEWVHLFPEARTWQEGGDPPRDAEGRWCAPSGSGRCGSPGGAALGPLKWGVGKLAANARYAPIVLPFFHDGMQPLVPQDGRNKVVMGPGAAGALGLAAHVLTSPAEVDVLVGEPVRVDDLIEDYHAAARARALERAAQRRRGREGGGYDGRAASDVVVAQAEQFAASISFPTPPSSNGGAAARVVPTRVLRSGAVVPAFVDAPLRARPPDHRLLTLAQAREEELRRLALYAAVTARIAQALEALEAEMAAKRGRRQAAVA